MNDNLTIPPSLQELLGKLQFLSMIKEGKKPCMNTMTFVDSRSWFGAVQRAFTGETKKSMVIHIDQIIKDVGKSLEEYKEFSNYMKLLVQSLHAAKNGISSLLITYSIDSFTVSQVKVILSQIDLYLSTHKNYLAPEVKEEGK